MNGTLYDSAMRPLELLGLRSLRSGLLSHASGKTLEIGIGTGLNLPFYPENADVTGIEPDEKMLLVARRKNTNQDIRLIQGDAEKLEFHNDEFDTVCGTLVFCTIPHPELAVKEVYRVLKPGGQLLLLEHVRKNTKVAGRILDLMTPVWKHLAGGCHLNRDPLPLLMKEGFIIEDSRILWKGLGRLLILRKSQG